MIHSRLLLLVVGLMVALPANAGQALRLRCADGRFEMDVYEGRGFAEAALGLQRTLLWCPDSRTVETAWLAGSDPIAQELRHLAASSVDDDQPVRVGRGEALQTLKITTVGDLRRVLAEPSGDDVRWRGRTCQRLRRYFTGEPFPLCEGTLEITVLPMVWD